MLKVWIIVWFATGLPLGKYYLVDGIYAREESCNLVIEEMRQESDGKLKCEAVAVHLGDWRLGESNPTHQALSKTMGGPSEKH